MARRLSQQNRMPPQSPQPPPQGQPRYHLRIEWILVPLCILGMTYVLSHIKPVIYWEDVMDYLHVDNTERYTMLGHLGLLGILVVAAVKIFGRK
jgi:hypothetical protein